MSTITIDISVSNERITTSRELVEVDNLNGSLRRQHQFEVLGTIDSIRDQIARGWGFGPKDVDDS